MDNVEGALRQFCFLLESSEDDLDKIAALSLASEHIQKEECDSRCKTLLFKSIGYDFLSRMLLGRLEIPGNDDSTLKSSVDAYRTTALTILTALCVDCELVRDQGFLEMTPHVFQILRELNSPSVVDDALLYFKCIVQHGEGRQSLVALDAFKEFARLYSHLKNDELIDILLILAQTPSDSDPWHKDPESFNKLMFALCSEFAKDSSKRKFVLCDRIRRVLYSNKRDIMNIEGFSHQKWPGLVLKGLRDILTSRIEESQRNPALKLASSMAEYFGLDWAAVDGDNPTQFQLILTHLASIEVRMQLEDQPVESILKNAELIVSCFTLLEVAIVELTENRLEVPKNQIIASFTEATNAVLVTLTAFSTIKETTESKLFIYAMIKFLAVGCTQDVLSVDSNIFQIMPFVMSRAEESFYQYEAWSKENFSESCDVVNLERPVDLLSVLLHAMRLLTIEEKGRSLIWSKMDLFLKYFSFHRKTMSSMERVADICLTKSRESYERSLKIVQHSREALVSLCDLLIETVVADPAQSELNQQNINDIFEGIVAMCSNPMKSLALHAPVAVLGLVLLRRRISTFKEQDASVIAVVKSATSFLAPYANLEAFDAAAIAIGDPRTPNTKLWLNLKDYWLVATQTLIFLFKNMPWIGEHIDSVSNDLFKKCVHKLEEQPS